MLDDLKQRRERLISQRDEYKTLLEGTLLGLDELIEAPNVNPRGSSRLLELEREAASLTSVVARLDAELETVAGQLRDAEAAAGEAALLNRLTDAGRAALAATASERDTYTAVERDLEALFVRVLAAADEGYRGRSAFRGLLQQHARAHAALGIPTPTTAAQDARAEEVDVALTARGVSIQAALEPAQLRYSALWSLAREWQREQATRPLEAVNV